MCLVISAVVSVVSTGRQFDGLSTQATNCIRCEIIVRMQGRFSIALGIGLACCQWAAALNPALDVEQYAHTAWTVRDGFFKGIIYAIAQTPDGYLWLETEFGLVRFDGVRSVPWETPPGEHLPGSDIRSLFATRDRRLWIGTTDEYANLRSYAYGLDAADQANNMTVNFTYNLPNATKLVKQKAIGYAFDHWVLSGISQFASGFPAAISFTTTNSENLNGGGDAQRVDVIGNAFSGNIHTFTQWFNTSAFVLPGMNDPGNAGKFDVRQPGVNNNDMAIAKSFPIKSEKRNLAFRWEAYNVFNHTQYAGLNTAAKFTPAGVQTNTLFGEVTSTRTPRVMQGSLRFTF